MPKNKGKGGKNRHRSNSDVSESFATIERIGDDFVHKVQVPQTTPIHSQSCCITQRSSHVSPVNNISLPSYDFNNSKKTKEIDNVFININKKDYIELQNDVKNMKNDIKQIKNTLGELVEMMKAFYEFEDI